MASTSQGNVDPHDNSRGSSKYDRRQGTYSIRQEKSSHSSVTSFFTVVLTPRAQDNIAEDRGALLCDHCENE